MDLLGHMATFVRVVDASSLSGAARALRLSLPAVSRQLRALEEEVGAPLILRTTRRMALTERGRLFYDSAVRILREVEEAKVRVTPSREVRGTLVVSASVSIALGLVLPLLPTLATRHPRMQVELRLEDHVVDLVREGVDVALRGGVAPPDSTAYVGHALARFRRIAVASPAYVRRRGAPRTPADLARHTCLVQLGATGAPMPWQLEQVDDAEQRRALSPDGVIRCRAPVALRDLTRAGAGVALLPAWLVEADLRSGALKRVIPRWHGPEIAIWAVHRVELKGSPLVGALLDLWREAA